MQAKIVKSSICANKAIHTIQVKAPKFLDAELCKHRLLSQNSSSDRAIPLEKMLSSEYFLPQDVRLNQAGMQGFTAMSDDEVAAFHEDLIALHGYTAQILRKWNHVHKQHLNRYLLGYSWQHKVITGTEWDNFFALRIHPMADPALQALATLIKGTIEASEPRTLYPGQWHLPYIESTVLEDAPISSARCARVSYNKHDGSTPSREEDLELFNQLVTRPYTDKRGTEYGLDDPIHASPLEHCAMAAPGTQSVNFTGWVQYRKVFENATQV